MSDGIIAISRKEEDPVDEEEKKTAEIVQTKRRRAKTYSDFVLTEFGVRDDVYNSRFRM